MALIPYDPRVCELCGSCLEACPVLDLSREDAKTEVYRLQQGDLTSPVLKACISCFACSAACPNRLDVHGLIMSLWHRQRRNRIPAHVRAALPNQVSPNPWSAVRRYFTPGEKELYSGLEDDVSGKDILYLGCNQLLDPYLTDSPLFGSLSPAAAPGVCCGEPYYRMGFLESYERAARSWLDHWEERSPSRMVVFCTPCLNMIKNVYPNLPGRTPGFPVIGVFEWLAEQVESGGVKPETSADQSLMVQHSCHSRVLGEPFLKDVDLLLEAAGVRRLKPASEEEDRACCGFAAASRRYNPLDMYRLGVRRLRSAEALQAEGIATYCNGCLLMLTMAERLSSSKLRTCHLVELLERACGYDLSRPHLRRAREIMTAAARTATGKIVLPGRNRLEF
ncbi:MAG: (Fe-S)-binding protein [bacterium]